jgi:zeta-carotene desaturase
MPSVLVVGGGLAGLAASAALADAGFDVDLFEARPFLGGRATSYTIPTGDGSFETVDNCQHVLLRCCVNLLDFYRRLGASADVAFHREFYWIEPGGRTSVFKAGRFPRPLHFAESFLRLKFLSFGEKVALARGLLKLGREYRTRGDLHAISMLDWLREQRQPPRVIERFWRQVLVSAINEDLDRMAAAHGFQVLALGFLATADGYEMGVPSVPLGELYRIENWVRWPNLRVHLRRPVDEVSIKGAMVAGRLHTADYYIVAVPFEKLGIAPAVQVPQLGHSPITGIHLWFDRAVTDLPHATLLDRTIQWMFNKGAGRQIQLVVSASRSLVELGRGEVIDLAVRELGEFFPEARTVRLLKAHVVKELRATFSAAPNAPRPETAVGDGKLFLAGEWTRSGWPATMEGAVRSGYLAAEAVTAAASCSARFLLPDRTV